MGCCLAKLSQFDAAEELLMQSLKIFHAVFPQGHDSIVVIEQILQKVRQVKHGQ
jgi:hypothetical protein